jgi:ribosomal protein L12E/L44/L45/RPP1/RPP2
MVDVFSYCYYKAYDFGKRDASDDFELRVLSHLVAHGLAIHFNIPGLRALTWEHFTTSFWSYAQQCPIEKLTAALNECFSPDFVMQSGFDEQAVASIRIEALAIFKHLIEQYKKSAKFKEVLDLIEAVPLAAAKLYSQPPTQNDDAEEDEDEDDEEEGESEDEDEVLELFNDASKRRKKEQYVTG